MPWTFTIHPGSLLLGMVIATVIVLVIALGPKVQFKSKKDKTPSGQ